MDLLWDKKMKMNNNMKKSNVGHSSSLLNRANELPGTKREISLLANRLNKLFSGNSNSIFK